MRVAMAGRYFNRQGGVSRCLAELAERAGREGHEVTVFSHEALDREGVEAQFTQVPMLERPFSLQIPSFSLALRRRLDRGAFDLVHGHGPQALGADIYTAHSCHAAFLYQRRREAGLKGALSHVYPPHELAQRWERRCFRGGKTVIAVSEAVRGELHEFLAIPLERIRVIYNGVDTAAFAPPESREAARAELGASALRGDDAMLVFVGYEFRRKGLATAIRALAAVDDTQLLVVGGDDPAPYRVLADQLGVGERVHFVGHQRDVVPWLQAADALVFPTAYEPFGLVILESLACGTPVLTSRLAGAAELVVDGTEGFLVDDPADAEELAAKLATFVSVRDRWPELGAAARHLAERHDWDASWAATERVYRELA